MPRDFPSWYPISQTFNGPLFKFQRKYLTTTVSQYSRKLFLITRVNKGGRQFSSWILLTVHFICCI